jgi:hypothetical protein
MYGFPSNFKIRTVNSLLRLQKTALLRSRHNRRLLRCSQAFIAFSASIFLAASYLILTAPANAVVSGKSQTNLNSMPFVGYYHAKVGIYFPWFSRDPEWCGATLIEANKAITAAHCVDGWNPGQMTVTFGRAAINGSGGQQRGVSKVVLAPNYQKSTHTPDYAILYLNRPIENVILPVVSPACSSWGPGSTMSVIGWGQSGRNGNGKPPENRAQLATVTYIGSDTDLSYVNERIDFKAAQSGTLQFGDSGSGLFYLDSAGRYELLGDLHAISLPATDDSQRTDAFTRLDIDSTNYPDFAQYIDTENSGEPSAPIGLTATPASNGLHISWNPPPSPACPDAAVTGYNVHIVGGGLDHVVQLQAYQTSWNIPNLKNGTKYIVYVAAVNKAGVGQTASITGTPQASSPPAIATTNLPDGYVGQEYSQELVTTDQRAGTWSVSTGSLPGGLTLSGSTIQGIPTTAGAFSFTVAFTDAQGQSASEQLSITVSPTAVSSWTPVEGGIPANASSNPYSSAGTGVSCPTASSCTAVGIYNLLTGTSVSSTAELLTESGGAWTATQAPLPPNAQTPASGVYSDAGLNGISCSSSSSCVADGTYVDTTGNSQGMLLTLAGGSWTAVQAPLPADASTTNPGASLNGISCASASSCIAVGTYNDSTNKAHALLLTLNGGSWTAAAAPIPANSPDNQGDLFGISCSSPSACTAVGNYSDSAGHSQGALLTLAGTAWTAAEAPLPADAATNPFTALSAVSCSSAATCVAAGDYYGPSSSGASGLLLTLSNGSWTAVTAPLPPGTSGTPAVRLSGVSCPTSSACVAGGYYSSNVNVDHGELLTLSNGSWSTINAPAPTNAGATIISRGFAVSCPSTSKCTATGQYSGSDGNDSLFLTGPA